MIISDFILRYGILEHHGLKASHFESEDEAIKAACDYINLQRKQVAIDLEKHPDITMPNPKMLDVLVHHEQGS